jgi:hypothetical protein
VHTVFNEGDMLRANFRTGEVKNLTSMKVLQADPISEIALEILNAGGIIAMLKKEYNKK